MDPCQGHLLTSKGMLVLFWDDKHGMWYVYHIVRWAS